MDVSASLSTAIKLIKSFNPAVSTVDTHVADTLGVFEDDDATKVFIQQTFFGCQRYKKALKVFLSSFYFNNSGATNRGDYHLYMVVAYLALFRLDELGARRFRQVLATQDTLKMHVMLSYMFNLHNLNVWCKEEWCKFLDRTFVEDTLIGGVEGHMDDVSAWLQENHAAAYGAAGAGATAGSGAAAPDATAGSGAPALATATGTVKGSAAVLSRAASSASKVTVPNPPKLTQPKPRVAPEPIKIEQKSFAKPVPNAIHRTSLEKVAATAGERRKAIKKKTEEKYSPTHHFKLHETKPTVDKIRAEVEAARAAELKFEGIKAKPVPKLPKDGAEVKLNIATVLREDMLFKQKQEQEARLIKEYESGLRDSTEYFQWQTEMRRKDEEARLQAVALRREEMAAAAVEAKDAFERQQFENRLIAKALREEGQIIKEALELEKQTELDSRKAMAEEVRQVRESAPKEAARRVLDSRVKQRNAIKEQSRRNAEQVAKVRAEEQKRKDDLIRQIRALERVPKVKVKAFDPTSSSNQGLLGEMSLVELKERLSMLKLRDAEEVQERREDILRAKREKEDAMRTRVANIARVRNAKAQAAAASRSRKLAEEERLAKVEQDLRDASSLRLAERLAAKKAAREAEEAKLAEETARIAKQRGFLGAAKDAMEERHFDQIMAAKERAAKSKQHTAKAQQDVIDRTAREVADAKRRTKAREAAARRQAEIEKTAGMGKSKEYAEAVALADMKRKKAMFLEETAREAAALEARDDRNRYAATQTKATLDEARKRWGGPPRDETHARTQTHRASQLRAAAAHSEVAAWGK